MRRALRTARRASSTCRRGSGASRVRQRHSRSASAASRRSVLRSCTAPASAAMTQAREPAPPGGIMTSWSQPAIDCAADRSRISA